MYREAIRSIRESVFPLFAWSSDGGKRRISVAGSGFFAGPEGHFVTAAHVITGIPAGVQVLYVGKTPGRGVVDPVEVEEVWSDPVKDIYVGKVATNRLPAVSLAPRDPEVGDAVCLSGYPMPRMSLRADGSIDVSQVRPYWQPTFVIDLFDDTVKGRHWIGFMTQHQSLPGMSGGPVFGPDGLVCGMDVGSMERKVFKPDGGKIVVANGLVIGVERLIDAL